MVRPPDPRSSELTAASIAAAQTAEDLALLLRTLRRRHARLRGAPELTYRALAARAGWSHAVVGAYFTGDTLPPTDRFDLLVRMLGATPAEQGALATARDRVEERRRARPNRRPAPRQLPAGVPGFVGRKPELARLNDFAAAARQPGAPTVGLVTGIAGCGKTALAVHWAHQMKRRFPQGQLYADLHGYAPTAAVAPHRVLDAYLLSLGVPAAGLPADLDAKAALYRSLLDGRRLLILLDNAADSQQVRPLLPGTPGCLVLVTSRSPLTGLVAHDRAVRIELGPLAPPEAVALLAGFIGKRRIAAEPAAARRLAELCGHLPVALCAAGARVADDPRSPLARIVADLTAADDPFDLLEATGDHRATVRAVFSWSYRRLSPPAARLLRALGERCRDHIDRSEAAGLVDTSPHRAGRLLEQLAAVGLLQPERPHRYRVPRLVRAYAAERARRHPLRQPRRPDPVPAPAPAPRAHR